MPSEQEGPAVSQRTYLVRSLRISFVLIVIFIFAAYGGWVWLERPPFKFVEKAELIDLRIETVGKTKSILRVYASKEETPDLLRLARNEVPKSWGSYQIAYTYERTYGRTYGSSLVSDGSNKVCVDLLEDRTYPSLVVIRTPVSWMDRVHLWLKRQFGGTRRKGISYSYTPRIER